MVDTSTVRFRWFRILETTCESVTLHPQNKDKWPDSIELVWDKHNMFYESSSIRVPCGKHHSSLYVDDVFYPCKLFAVVNGTFEVHLFLNKEKGHEERCLITNTCLSPVPLNTDWSINESYWIERKNRSKYYDCLSELPRDSRSPVTLTLSAYEEMLAGKNQEIRNLQNELKQLRLTMMDIYSRSLNKTPDSINQASDLDDIKFDTSFTDNKIVENGIEENPNAEHVKISSESETLKTLLITMKATRDELRVVSVKNTELNEELQRLREDNDRLRKMMKTSDETDSKLPEVDLLYFSELNSDSTQYNQLPSCMTNIYTSKSLPTLESQKYPPTPPRRFSSLCILSPRNSGDHVRMKVGSSVQTDITALEDPPKILKRTKRRNKPQTQSSEQSLLYLSSLKDSDTEDLLQEAENFILTTLGNIDIPHTVSKQTANESTLGSVLTGSLGIDDGIHGSTSLQPSPNFTTLGKRTKLRPFIPKSTSDLRPGHTIKYFTSGGKVEQGKVAYLSSNPGETNVTIVTEEISSDRSFISSSPRRSFVPLKKVILAWEEWNSPSF